MLEVVQGRVVQLDLVLPVRGQAVVYEEVLDSTWPGFSLEHVLFFLGRARYALRCLEFKHMDVTAANARGAYKARAGSQLETKMEN